MTSLLKSVLVGAVVLVAVVSTAQAAELVSHRAAYSVGLAGARDGSVLSTVSGQIAYGVEKVCGGWLQAQSGTMNMHLSSGDVVPQTLHFSSWEADDASRYRFTVKSEGDNAETVLGSAQVNAGAAGTASFTQPKIAEFTLPQGTLFPVAHTAFMIDAARAGKAQVESYIFEGLEVEGAKLLVAFISPMSVEAKAVTDRLGGDLVGRQGWNFRLAYFDPKSQTGEPLYELEADLLDNGVAPRWVWDYGSYAVEMKLTKLEILAAPDC